MAWWHWSLLAMAALVSGVIDAYFDAKLGREDEDESTL